MDFISKADLIKVIEFYYKVSIPYSGKVWRGESLANLANCRQFAKLKPSKLIPTIDNLLADLFIRQTFFPPNAQK